MQNENGVIETTLVSGETNVASASIIAEVELNYSDNLIIGEGSCSCVCINDESCCGCPSQ
jgi:hypothetical protein